MTQPIYRRYLTVWMALLVTGVCLFYLQYSTLPKMRDFIITSSTNASLASIRGGTVSLLLTHLGEILGPVDYLLIGVLGLVAIGSLVLELRRNLLSEFVANLVTDRRALLLFLFVSSVICTRYYLNPGDVFMGDAKSLGPRVWMVAENLRHLQAPVWSNYWYGGFPLLEFYAPLYFVVTGTVTAVLGDVHLATKLCLWAAHVGSIFAMFYFLREATRNVNQALLGAFAYAVVFFRINLMLYQGDLNVSLIWLLYPVLLFLVEAHLHGRLGPKRHFLLSSFTIAALVLTHHAYAFFGLVFVVVYVLVRVWTWDAPSRARWHALRYLTLAALAGGVLSSFSWLPFVLEYHQVRGMPGLPFSHLLLAPPPLRVMAALLHWSPTGNEHGTESYMGVSLLAFALLSMVYLAKRRESPGLALAVCVLVSLGTVKSGTQYNTKNLNFVVFYVAALAAYAPSAVGALIDRFARLRARAQAWGPLREQKILILLLGILLIDFGPLTAQNTFIPGYYQFQEQMYQRVLSLNPNYRVFERRVINYEPAKGLSGNFERNQLGIILGYSPIVTPLGNFNEGGSRFMSYSAEFMKRILLDLNTGRISDTGVDGAYLMGVKYLLFRDRSHYFEPPLEAGPGYSVHDSVVDFQWTRPLLAAPRLVDAANVPGRDANNPIDNDGYYDADAINFDLPYFGTAVAPLLQTMRIDAGQGTADALIVRDQRAPVNRSLSPATIDVSEFAVDINTVRIRYRSSAGTYAQIPYAYFPYLDLRVDGQPVPFFRSAVETIVLELPPGEHLISMRGVASPVAKWALLVAMLALLAVVAAPTRMLTSLSRP